MEAQWREKVFCGFLEAINASTKNVKIIMGDKSKIHWLLGGASWNPAMGCCEISEGCRNCYAMSMIRRFAGKNPGFPKEPGKVELFPGRIDQPVRWTRPRRIFVCSMGDLFHTQVPYEYIREVYKAMIAAPQHTYLVLTKRPGKMSRFLKKMKEEWATDFEVPGNIQHGVTVEDSTTIDRVGVLKGCPVKRKFVSFEPLLSDPFGDLEFGTVLEDIDWVIIGGESGPSARPMKEEWVDEIIGEARECHSSIFVKQMGSVWAKEHGSKSNNGDIMEEWPTWCQIREVI